MMTIKRCVAALLVLAGLCSPATAGSTINPIVPAQNAPLASAPMRGNFLAAYNDINHLLGKFAGNTAPSSPTVWQDWVDTSVSPFLWKIFTPSGWITVGTFNSSTGAFTPTGVFTGGVFTGRIVTAPPGASTAGFNLTPGTTPSSPANGDLWATSGGLFARINGTTLGPITGPSSGSFAATNPITVAFPAGVVTFAISDGTSVANPGTGVLEALLPIQTVVGTSRAFATADFFKETRRSNTGSAMSDTFPASSATGLVNGTKIVVTNVDATAADTITAGAGTTIGGTGIVAAGRTVQYVYDAPSTTWRPTLNTGTALLGPATNNAAIIGGLNNTVQYASPGPVQGCLSSTGTGTSPSFGSTSFSQCGPVSYVNTIAALKDINVGTTVDVYVRGYNAVGDGGGGWFYGDAISTCTDNGGTCIAPNVGSGRWLRRLDTTARYLAWYGRGDWCGNLSAAMSDIGSGNPGTVIVDSTAGPTSCSAVSTIMLNPNLRILFVGGGEYTLNRTIQFGQGNELDGVGGGTGPSVIPPTGTRFKWTGATSTPMLKFFGAAHSYFHNGALDCNNVSGCIGILMDSDNNPPTTENVIENFSIVGFHVGINIGSTSTTAVSGASCNADHTQSGCSENDGFSIRNFQMYGNCSDPTAIGFHINSLNAAQLSTIGGQGNIQCVNIGVRIINMNDTLTLTGFAAGSMIGANRTLVSIGSSVTNGPDMVGLDSEAGEFAVVDHSCGGAATWQNNQWNQPIVADGCNVITSISNTGGTVGGWVASGTVQVKSIGDSNENAWASSGSAVATYYPSPTQPLPATAGGTGFSSYVAGDLLAAGGTGTLAKISDVAVNNVLLSGGIGALPSYGKVPNAALVNSSLTVNGTSISLGGSATVTAPLTVGTTTISGGTTLGVLYNNAGVLGNTAAAGTNGQLFLGVTSGAPVFATMSGDATITNAGVLTIADATVTYTKIANVGALSVMGRSANSSGVGNNIQATAASGAVLRESGSVIGFGTIATAGIADNAVTLAKLAAQGTNTVLVNATSGSAVPTAQTVSSCSTAASALIWTTNTGLGCNTSITAASMPTTGLTGTLQAAQEPAHTGDVTNSAGSLTTVLANIPTGVPAAGSILFTNITAPSSPASGKVSIFADSTDLRFHDKNASGVIGTTVVADTGAANNYISAISAAGAITKSRPTCSTLSDSSTGCATTVGTMATQSASAVAITGGTVVGLTGLAIRDTSAAFDLTIAATSSAALTAGRTLTLNMGNVAHTLAFGTTANTITFPNAASDTVAMLAVANTFTGINTFSNSTASTSLSTGAVVISTGGLAVGGAQYIGTKLSVGANADAAGAGTLADFNAANPNVRFLGNTTNDQVQFSFVHSYTGNDQTWQFGMAGSSPPSGFANRDFYIRDGGGTAYFGITSAGLPKVTTLNITSIANVATTSAVCVNTTSGLLTYDGTIGTCTVSDERLKDFSGPIGGALDKLLKIHGMYYTWKDPKAYGAGRQIGVGAQTVEKVFPELVQTDLHGYKSADYQRLVAPVIEALRELKAANDNLKARLILLERKAR